jgi:succinylarginine dihydrolase
VTIAHEVNFDGIVGPTHNYAGLSYGNVASMSNKSSVSNPRQAALEGLAKMRFFATLGLKQAVLPPHERPHLPTLRARGYEGDDAAILATVAKEDPQLLAKVSSASAMWAANAATVSPSADTADGRVHFTPANLVSNLHRSIEAPTTARILRKMFSNPRYFEVLDPLPGDLPDEGAANHTRLCRSHEQAGIELFACGPWSIQTPTKYPARQNFAASHCVSARHLALYVEFVMQNPIAIDAGAFHNDVVAVGNRTILLHHELAWLDAAAAIARMKKRLPELRVIEVKDQDVPLADAISTYLFNSQLVTLPDGSDALIAPIESREHPRVRSAIESLGIPAHYVDVRQSMRNGGGPACLRLRVVLTEEELQAAHAGVMFSDALHDSLHAWITRHYREELQPVDLADPKLLAESRTALDKLTQILGLGSLYDFQR